MTKAVALHSSAPPAGLVSAAGRRLGLPEFPAASAFILSTLSLFLFSLQQVLLVPVLLTYPPGVQPLTLLVPLVLI